MHINGHYLLGVPYVASPNHSEVIINPRFVVMHYTAGYTAESAVRTLTTRGTSASAHLVIDRDGSIKQLVPFNKRAWHAGPSEYKGFSDLNSHSIGIELVNIGWLREGALGTFVDSYGAVIARNDPRLAGSAFIQRPNPRAGSGTFIWPGYTESQLAATEKVFTALVAAYPSIVDVVSHEEIDTRGWKTDPGPAFPMVRYKRLLNDREVGALPYVVTASTLNVRGGPGTHFAVIGKLLYGAQVRDRGRRGDWVRISDEGWVYGDYLRLG